MNFSFTKQLWIFVGIILSSILIFFVAIFFIKNNIENSVGTIATDENAIASQNAAISVFSNLKISVADARHYEAAMGKLLVSQDDLITFPSTLDGLGRKEGVITRFSFIGDPVPGTPSAAGSLGFSLEVTGPVQGIIAFIKDIEVTSPVLLLQLDGFDLSQNGSNYTFTTRGTLFFK